MNSKALRLKRQLADTLLAFRKRSGLARREVDEALGLGHGKTQRFESYTSAIIRKSEITELARMYRLSPKESRELVKLWEEFYKEYKAGKNK